MSRVPRFSSVEEADEWLQALEAHKARIKINVGDLVAFVEHPTGVTPTPAANHIQIGDRAWVIAVALEPYPDDVHVRMIKSNYEFAVPRRCITRIIP